MAQKIENLLFDLGGVILDIERQRCVDAFTALGLPDADSYFGDFAQTGPFAQLEKGILSPAQLHDILRQRIPHPVTDDQLDRAFGRFLVGIPRERLAALRSLRKRFRIYLLSNTNAIMWHAEIARMFRIEGHEREDYFDGIVTSFEAHMLKPDPALFAYTATHLGIDPAATLFFDDSIANVAAARQCGYLAEHVTPHRGFMTILNSLCEP